MTAITNTGGSLPTGWFDVTAYGADKTGVADSTTAIQAGLNAVNVAGGTLYFPTGTYKVSSPLHADLNTDFGVTLLGASTAQNMDMAISKLLYTGTTGSLLQIRSCSNVEIANLGFQYNSASFTGDLIDVNGLTPHAVDCQEIHIHHCSGKSSTGIQTARSILHMEKVIISTVEHCHFGRAANGIRLGDPPGAGGTFIVACQVEKCTFNFNTDAHIFIGTGDGESITIRDCTFEAGTNTTGIRGATVAVDGASNLNALYTPVIEGNWFGDAGGVTKWIDGLNTINVNFPGMIRCNRFGETNFGVHLTLTGTWNSIGNSFDGQGTIYGGGPVGGYGNGIPSTLTLASGTSANGIFEMGATNTTTAPNRLPRKVWYGPNTNEDVLDSGEVGLVTLVNHVAGPQLPYATAAVVAADKFGELNLLGAAGGGACLVSGTSPVRTVQASRVGATAALGFFGASPVVQPTRAGQLTDSTGGTVSGTLAAGIVDAVAKNAIASLAAKVNALETIIHNYGLST